MIGIPGSFLFAPAMLVVEIVKSASEGGSGPMAYQHEYGMLAAAFFAGGYALQFIGHLIEGNRSGEEELIRKIISRFKRG
jgi:hypothetical protein